MSLLNQVLQDLDDRMPSEERPSIRLSVAPAAQRAATDASEFRKDRIRLWVGIIVVAAFVAAVWAFHSADKGLSNTRVTRLSIPAPGAAIAKSPPRETPVALAASPDTVEYDAQRSPKSSLPAKIGGVGKPVPEPKPAATGPSLEGPVAVMPGPGGAVPHDPSAQVVERKEVLSARIADKAPVSYLPLRNTVLPETGSSGPIQDHRGLKTDAQVKTARSPTPFSLEEVRAEIELGELSHAEYLLQRRLREASDDPEARELLVGLMLRGERYDAAMHQIDEGLRHDPGHIKFLLIKARLLAQSGRDEAAIRVLESVSSTRVGAVERLQMLGALYQQQLRYDDAKESYRALLNLMPSSGPAWVGLAISLDSQGEAAAREAYGRALRLGGLPAAAEAYSQQRISQMESEVD